MNSTQITNEIQFLMNIQQTKLHQNGFCQKYNWISRKQYCIRILSAKDEFLIFRALETVNQEQKVEALKQLLDWFETHPQTQVAKIPEMYLSFLHEFHTINILNNVTLSRKISIRNSFRRLANKIAPSPILPSKIHKQVEISHISN